MDWWLFSFFIGAIWALFLPIVPVIFILFIVLIAIIVIFRFKGSLFVSGLLLGYAWLAYSAYQYQIVVSQYQFNLPVLIIEGEIVTFPSHKLGTSRFNFRVSRLNGDIVTTPFIVRLRWFQARFILQQGQKLQLQVKLKPAHGLANPGGFNYQAWLKTQQIIATGYIKTSAKNKLLVDEKNQRTRLYQEYLKLIPEHELSALLLSLSFGDRSQITLPAWQILQATGTQHLLAISGLHLGLVASGSFVIFLYLLRYLPLTSLMAIFPLGDIKRRAGFFLTLNYRYLVIFLSLSLTYFYAYLAQFSLPTSRALIMLAVYWGMRLLAIKLSIRRWLLLTVTLLIVLNPFSLLSSSFWLSLYAVGLIFIIHWRFIHYMAKGGMLARFLKGLFCIQLALTVLLMPLTAMFYQQISISALFANLFAVPLMSMVTIPLALFSVVSLYLHDGVAELFIEGALYSLVIVWWWLSFWAQQPFSIISLSVQQAYLLSVVVVILAYWVFILPNIFNGCYRYIMMLALAFIWRYWPITHDNNSWQVNVLDVGQGLAVVIEKNNRAILYDTGAAYPSGFAMAESVILPYLRHQGVKKLDKVIISHGDNDHAGGLSILQNSIPIDELIFNSAKNSVRKLCLQGRHFIWQGLTFTMLWPELPKGDENDDSCVVHVSDGRHSVLLTGDISAKVERQLLNSGYDLQVDVLISPHHGSTTSSHRKFLQRVKPDFSVFSAGYLNQWHMPVAKVVKRYHDEKIMTYNTASQGMIRFDFKDKSINVVTYREHIWPYWFAN